MRQCMTMLFRSTTRPTAHEWKLLRQNSGAGRVVTVLKVHLKRSSFETKKCERVEIPKSSQEPTKAKVFSSCRPDFQEVAHCSSSLFFPFPELSDRKVAVSCGALYCVVQSCCESVWILSKSFESHMLGVWRTLHRCQSSHFPRDSVPVTCLFKIQSPSLHLSSLSLK